MLFISHILIRHERSPRTAPLFATGWEPLPEAPARSRDEARALAESLQLRAQRDPSSFAQLAHEHSEDIVTRDRGGSLGPTAAPALMPFPQVLDVLAALPRGAVSSVVETPAGFHVFLRRPPPTEASIAGRRIVLGYKGADWLALSQREGTIPGRSREEALRLASAIAAKARSGEDFSTLAARYSEHRDALRGGDLGVHSSFEPGPVAREVERLSALAVGKVSEPFDTPVGITILERTAEVERPLLAMEQLRQSFDPSARADAPNSREAVLRSLRRLRDGVAASETRWNEQRAQHCCEATEQWNAGRGSPVLERVLASLPIGAVSREPVLDGAQWALVKRLPPSERAPDGPEPIFDLPRPEAPNIERLVRNADGKQLAKYVHSFEHDSRQALGLVGERGESFAALHRSLANELESEADPERRLSSLHGALASLRLTLGESDFNAYTRFLHAHVGRVVFQLN